MKVVVKKPFTFQVRRRQLGDELNVSLDKAKCWRAFGLASIAPRPLSGIDL